MPHITSLRVGKKAENLVDNIFLDKGFWLFKPVVDDFEVDRLIINPKTKKQFLIQIKSTSSEQEKPSENGRFPKVPVKFTAKNHFFIFYSQFINKFFIVPSKALLSQKLKLYKDKYKTKQGYEITIRVFGVVKQKPIISPKFQKYLENWKVFDK